MIIMTLHGTRGSTVFVGGSCNGAPSCSNAAIMSTHGEPNKWYIQQRSGACRRVKRSANGWLLLSFNAAHRDIPWLASLQAGLMDPAPRACKCKPEMTLLAIACRPFPQDILPPCTCALRALSRPHRNRSPARPASACQGARGPVITALYTIGATADRCIAR